MTRVDKMYTCTLCNKEFKDRRSLAYHVARIERSKFNSDADAERFVVDTIFGKEVVDSLVDRYLAMEVCCYDLQKSGQDISKYLALSGLKRSSSEERSTERYKKTYLDGIQSVYGEGVTNISQVAEVQAKKEQTVATNYGSYEEYLANNRERMAVGYASYASDSSRLQTTHDKMKRTFEHRYGTTNAGQIDHVRKTNSTHKKAFWSKFGYDERLAMTEAARSSVCARGGYESNLERRVQHCLVDMGIEFKKHVMISGYNYDMLIAENIVIEVQGDFWHGNPLKYSADDTIIGTRKVADVWEKDAKKKKAVEENGYKLVYLWETEIKSCVTQTQLIDLISSKIEEVLT